MGKILVVYRSKYGFTQKYAEWIAETLHADLKEGHNVKPDDLKHYDVIIYGGGLYAGGVNGISAFVKAFPKMKDKALYLFTVGAADVLDPKNITRIRSELNKVLSPEMQEKVKIYHFRGGIDYPHLSIVHRAMMSMMIRMLRKKPQSELRSDDIAMLETYGQLVDFTNRSTIAPLIQDVEATLLSSSPQTD